jgi:pSer/pThr/pTyr-binding forkhead associated (FHA) protein
MRGDAAPAKSRTIIDTSGPGQALRRIEGALFLYADPDDAGAIVPLYSGRSTIGRDPSRDVVIDDGRVSSEHGFLLLRPDGGSYVDTSTNGSLIDGQVVHLNQVEIQHGSVLVLGNIHAVFVVLPTRPFEGR